MQPNVSKLQFYGGYPIDKIVDQDSFSISVPKASSNISPTIVTTTQPNTYGKTGYTTVSYSIDNINFYDQSASIFYWNTVNAETDIQLSVTSACDDNTVYFMATSYYLPTDQTLYINYAVDTIS